MLKKIVVLITFTCIVLSTLCFGGEDDLPNPIYKSMTISNVYPEMIVSKK